VPTCKPGFTCNFESSRCERIGDAGTNDGSDGLARFDSLVSAPDVLPQTDVPPLADTAPADTALPPTDTNINISPGVDSLPSTPDAGQFDSSVAPDVPQNLPADAPSVTQPPDAPMVGNAPDVSPDLGISDRASDVPFGSASDTASIAPDTARACTTPACVADCGPLATPANGTVSTPATTEGSTATYLCTTTGYVLSGGAARTCQSSGVWSGSAPTCLPADCGVLSAPVNGVVVAPTTTYGSTAIYSCMTAGYTLSGGAARICQSSGSWSGGTPTCVPVDCGVLSAPDNGAVVAPTTTSSSTATYSCRTAGYILSGAATRTCQSSGTWSGSAPTCVPVDCGTLTAPTNGAVVVPTTTYGSTATYSCTTAGYTLFGGAVRTCQSNGTWSESAPSCGVIGPSCAGLAATCGPSSNENCCASSLVSGDTFNRDDNASYPATVSDFMLDKYEVTVGRFRAFVNAGMGTQVSPPAAGTGAHPLITGTGWDSNWNSSLAADTAALMTKLQCAPSYQTWTNAAGANERLPINCLSWYEAFAFCAWDGGRLATEAEWSYAAAGGSEQRLYPWGSTEPGPNANLAVYGCYYNGTGTCVGIGNIAPVGSAPAGNGKWGQSDLGGSMWEWNFDWYRPYTVPCNNCVQSISALDRGARSGSFDSTSTLYLRSDHRDSCSPEYRFQYLGARCARRKP
jgi:formylglycine-generating enzyme